MMTSDVLLYGDIEDNLFYQLYIFIEPIAFYVFWAIFGSVSLYYALKKWEGDSYLILGVWWGYYTVYSLVAFAFALAVGLAFFTIGLITLACFAIAVSGVE
jgi:hypothetical protein